MYHVQDAIINIRRCLKEWSFFNNRGRGLLDWGEEKYLDPLRGEYQMRGKVHPFLAHKKSCTLLLLKGVGLEEFEPIGEGVRKQFGPLLFMWESTKPPSPHIANKISLPYNQ